MSFDIDTYGMPIIHLKTPLIDASLMETHRERYRGWSVVVEVAGTSVGKSVVTGLAGYLPRIIVTEQLSIGFRELDVPAHCSYATPEECFRGGMQTARKFIDGRA